MDVERLMKIRCIAHQLIDEIEFMAVCDRAAEAIVRPRPEALRGFHRNLDCCILVIQAGGASWNGGHQEDELEAVGLVNRLIDLHILIRPTIQVKVKYRRFEQLFCRAKPDEWVPPLADQLRGAKPIGKGQMN